MQAYIYTNLFTFFLLRILEYCESHFPNLIQGILPLCSPSPNLSSKVYDRFSVSLFPLCINLSIHPKRNSFPNNSLKLFSSGTPMNFALPWDSWLYLHRFSRRFQQSVTSSSLKHFHGARASFRFCLHYYFLSFLYPFLAGWNSGFTILLTTFLPLSQNVPCWGPSTFLGF